MRNIISASMMAAALTACSSGSSDSDYDKCVQQAAQAPTATGVNAGYANCAQRYTREKQAEQDAASHSPPGTVANAYWDGWKFQSGPMPDTLKGKGYRIFSVARFGVPVCEVALPTAMGKVLFDDKGGFKESEPLNADLLKVCHP